MHVLDSHQLTAAGWTAARVRAAARSGELVRVRRGHYLAEASADPVQRHRAALEATQRVLRGQWWFSHTSAAVLHGLPVPRTDLEQVDVTRASTSGMSSRPGLKRWCGPVPLADRTEIDGHPVTGLARTLTDLARTSEDVWAVAAMDTALHRGDVTLDELREQLRSAPRRPGNRSARERFELADPLSESVGESISRVNMVLAGIPRPELQHQFVLPSAALARTDFWWPEFRLVGEFDGAIKYDGPEGRRVLLAEKAREDELRQLGLTLVRWGWDLACNRALLAARLRGAMSDASRIHR